MDIREEWWLPRLRVMLLVAFVALLSRGVRSAD
jgi:hypothetical protein